MKARRVVCDGREIRPGDVLEVIHAHTLLLPSGGKRSEPRMEVGLEVVAVSVYVVNMRYAMLVDLGARITARVWPDQRVTVKRDNY